MERAIRITEDIPVAHEADVAVIGGGPAGVGAALSAARLGLKVIVIEQANCLGGIATSGWHGHICIYSSWARHDERVVGGICHEMAERTVKRGYGAFDNQSFDFEVEPLKLILEEMAAEARVKVLYYTQFSTAVRSGGRITSVIIQNKSGRQAVNARMFIDCTGDADVAARAGVGFDKGRPDDGRMQAMTLMFQIGGVDYDKVRAFRQGGGYKEKYGEDAEWWKLSGVWKEAQKNGDMEPFQDQIMGWWFTPTRPDQLGINFTHIPRRDCTNAEDLTYATIEGRRQAFHLINVYRKYIPGMEHCWLSHTAAIVGTRESRRIHGEYQIHENDLVAQKEFDDSIGYGSFFIDIHSCSGPGMDAETWRPPQGFKYQIPYRALVPKGIDNLLVAGRCVSCTHKALGSLRVMPQCVLEGEACGVAAREALSANVAPRGVDVKRVQAQLRTQGAIVFDKDIVRS
ncbi:FAD-dependent oxidoreductase [bacterium]|nr:FAD-dependent oxidoreductase [bacterium]